MLTSSPCSPLTVQIVEVEEEKVTGLPELLAFALTALTVKGASP